MKSAHYFCSNAAHRQTDRTADKPTSSHNLWFAGGKNKTIYATLMKTKLTAVFTTKKLLMYGKNRTVLLGRFEDVSNKTKLLHFLGATCISRCRPVNWKRVCGRADRDTASDIDRAWTPQRADCRHSDTWYQSRRSELETGPSCQGSSSATPPEQLPKPHHTQPAVIHT